MIMAQRQFSVTKASWAAIAVIAAVVSSPAAASGTQKDPAGDAVYPFLPPPPFPPSDLVQVNLTQQGPDWHVRIETAGPITPAHFFMPTSIRAGIEFNTNPSSGWEPLQNFEPHLPHLARFDVLDVAVHLMPGMPPNQAQLLQFGSPVSFFFPITYPPDGRSIEFNLPTSIMGAGPIQFATIVGNQIAFTDATSVPGTTEPIGPCPADIDDSGNVDTRDLDLLLDSFSFSMGQPGFLPAADLDGSGTVDIFDLATCWRTSAARD